MWVGRLTCSPADALSARPATCGALGRANVNSDTFFAHRAVAGTQLPKVCQRPALGHGASKTVCGGKPVWDYNWFSGI